MKYGARVYFHNDGTILIKQTILRDGGREYVIDHDDRGEPMEDYASAVEGQADRVLAILQAASRGELRARGTAVAF
jgi:hypothetical protein